MSTGKAAPVLLACLLILAACARPGGQLGRTAGDREPAATAAQSPTAPPHADLERPAERPSGDGATPEAPATGSGTFSVARGATAVVGEGRRLVRYRVEVERGIRWGENPVWTPARFASAVDQILAHPQGWTASAEHPITDRGEGLTRASWAFQRVSGGRFGVQIRLATPDTVDRICGAAGLRTEGLYSCRVGETVMINLRRWLHGAPGFPLASYRHSVVNHELGHFLGFSHMRCPGQGEVAPIMQTQTIDLGGCQPNPYPFTAGGRFVRGPR